MTRKLILIIFASLQLLSFAQSKDELFLRDSALLAKELHEMVKADQHRNRRGDMSATDNANTQRMIAIINAYGYPSAGRLGFKGNAGAILVHTPMKYADTLRTLLETEKQAGRISNNEYAYINWHLDGRVGPPAFDSASGIKIKDKRSHSKPVIEIGILKTDSLK